MNKVTINHTTTNQTASPTRQCNTYWQDMCRTVYAFYGKLIRLPVKT